MGAKKPSYRVDIISNRLVSRVEELRNEFPKESPIPGFVYYELVDNSRVYLKNANFDPQLLELTGEMGENLDIIPGYSGQKIQKVFLHRSDGRCFHHAFISLNIRDIIKKRFPNKNFRDIEKIVIATKYTWRLGSKKSIFEEDRSVLVFDLLPEHKQALEQEMQKF